MPYTRTEFEAAAQFIQEQIQTPPKIAMILGSGLGPLADQVEDATILPYEDIPHWPQPSVSGHAGRLVMGQLQGQTVMVMQGRTHYYEGYPMAAIAFPIRVMQTLGIQTLIVTNAAGGINASYRAGDLMIIVDHINFLGMVGANPLMGANDPELGTRFPPMDNAYDRDLRRMAIRVAEAQSIDLRQGVYIGLSGPFFETPAEVRMLRVLGADAVGMSTVSEVTVACHAGMRVLGFSTITNMAIDTLDSDLVVSHDSVLEMGRSVVPRLMTVLRGVLKEMGNDG